MDKIWEALLQPEGCQFPSLADDPTIIGRLNRFHTRLRMVAAELQAVERGEREFDQQFLETMYHIYPCLIEATPELLIGRRWGWAHFLQLMEELTNDTL